MPDEQGFSLIEVLVVMVVLGLLAAIAIPQFLGQAEKADGASAKTDVRTVVQMVEMCRVEQDSYENCDEQDELDGAPGVSWGQDAGQSGVKEGATKDGFVAYSVSRDDDAGVFAWVQTARGMTDRCVGDTVEAIDASGCAESGW